MRILLRELTTGNTVICLYELLWECRIFKRPEAEIAVFERFVLLHSNIILTIASRDQIWVGFVNIDTSYGSL